MIGSTVRIVPVTNEEDIAACFECMSTAFGTREKPLFNALYPLHDTDAGRAKGIARLRLAWRSQRHDESHYYIKAVLKDEKDGTERIAGFALWMLARPGDGGTSENVEDELDLNAIYTPDQVAEREWLRQIWRAYVAPRRRASSVDAKTIMALELCAVHPSFQRLGVGLALSRWGIDQARRIHACKAVVEATQLGVGVYARAGFKHSEPIAFDNVDPELVAVRPLPKLTFMQTDLLSSPS